MIANCKQLIQTRTWSLFGHFYQLFNLFVVQHFSLVVSYHHQLDVLVARLHNVQQGLHDQFQPLFVRQAILVVFFQEFTDLLRVPATGLSFPLRKRPRRISIVEVRSSGVVEPCEKAADSKRTHSSLLSIFLLGLCDIFGDVFHWRIVIVIEPVALALHPRLIRQNSAIGSKAGVCHVDAIIQLHDLLYRLSVLQLSHCFFLHGAERT